MITDVAAGVDVRRDAFAKNADSLSGSGFESFVIVDQRYVIKHVNADLALLGAFTQLGWSKTGDPAEFEWWTRRITATARELTK